ncbi:hypothetical protein LCGC14_0757670 [marine sediment metagenome]|uniref:Uncharacterized protein n=1 Tax=marine sediment metagenome TaxID=412755 RepID=A0A0F9QLX8_9ZZZZ
MDTVTVDDSDRRAVAHSFGLCGELASRGDMRQYIHDLGVLSLEAIASDPDRCRRCNPESYDRIAHVVNTGRAAAG